MSPVWTVLTAGADDLVVPRLELYDRLSGAARVTQLSAAAGSGKTVLLRSWIDHARLATRAARVLVEQDERDAQRFWLSVLGAVRRTTAGRRSWFANSTAAPDLDGWTIVERLIEDLAQATGANLAGNRRPARAALG